MSKWCYTGDIHESYFVLYGWSIPEIIGKLEELKLPIGSEFPEISFNIYEVTDYPSFEGEICHYIEFSESAFRDMDFEDTIRDFRALYINIAEIFPDEQDLSGYYTKMLVARYIDVYMGEERGTVVFRDEPNYFAGTHTCKEKKLIEARIKIEDTFYREEE